MKEAEKRRKEKPEPPFVCQAINFEIVACKLKTFSVEKKSIDKMMGEIRGHSKLILDLRGNRGGLVSIEEYLVGHFFDHDIKIATFITRDRSKNRIAKTQGEKVFKDEIVVLVDSDSASASEVFARVIQLEKRGKVVGDNSAGAVMTSNMIGMDNSRGVEGSFATYSSFGLNLTVADLIMSDGNRLEKVGVIPDLPARPTALALREKWDPVLAYSASIFGAKLTPAEAGNFNFILKKQVDEEDEKKDDGDKIRFH